MINFLKDNINHFKHLVFSMPNRELQKNFSVYLLFSISILTNLRTIFKIMSAQIKNVNNNIIFIFSIYISKLPYLSTLKSKRKMFHNTR
jgi:hypothetical protein